MASKHTYEPALDSCAITIHPKLEIKYKLFRKTEYKMTVAKAVLALCEEAVKDVPLTKKEVLAIEADMELARKKRMANRVKVAAYNKGLLDGRFRKGK